MANANELYHYGVIGMKWGVHKAKSYAYDTSAHVMKRKVKAAKKDLRRGRISKSEFARIKRSAEKERERSDIQTNRDLSKVKVDKSKLVSDIYGEYKKKAISEIPHYQAKRGAKTAAKALAVIGAAGVAAYSVKYMDKKDMFGVSMRQKDVATNFIKGTKSLLTGDVKGAKRASVAIKVGQHLDDIRNIAGAGAAAGAVTYGAKKHKKYNRTR